MAARLETTLKDHLIDPEGEGVRKKALAYFGIQAERIRSVSILTIDADLSTDQLARIRQEMFTNPVTQVSSYAPAGAALRLGDLGRPAARGARQPGRHGRGGDRGSARSALPPRTGGLHLQALLHSGTPPDAPGRRDDRRAAARQRHHPAVAGLVGRRMEPGGGGGDHHPQGPARPHAHRERRPHRKRCRFAAHQRRAQPRPEPERHPRHPRLLQHPGGAHGACGRRSFGPDRCRARIHLPGAQRPLQSQHLPRPLPLPRIGRRPGRGRRQPVQDLHRGPHAGAGRAQALGGIRAVGQRRAPAASTTSTTTSSRAKPTTRPPTWRPTAGPSPASWASTGTLWAPARGPGWSWAATASASGRATTTGRSSPGCTPGGCWTASSRACATAGNKSGIPTAFGQVSFHPGYLGKCLVFVTAVGVMPSRVHGTPGRAEADLARGADRHVRRPGGQGRHPRRHGLLGGVLGAHAGRPRADRRPVHPEEDARLPAGGARRGPDPVHHRQRRRRAVLVGG